MANGALLHQSVSAWLRVIGRLKPGASIAGMAPRLTGVLRQWMQNDAGYPCQLDAGVIRDASQASDQRCACRRRCCGHERGVRAQPADSARLCADWCC